MMKFYDIFKTLAVVTLMVYTLPANARIDLLKNGISSWKSHKFMGSTRYSVVGNGVIRAFSKSSASGIFYEKKIDLDKTPVLSWKWKVTQAVKTKNEKTKAGDDYSARIYVVKSNKVLFWKTITLNYVWASTAAVGDNWNSPYTSNSKMVVKATGGAHDEWKNAKVNLKRDFKKYFGKDIRYVDAIAIMTDTDNTKGVAEAYYSSLKLSSE